MSEVMNKFPEDEQIKTRLEAVETIAGKWLARSSDEPEAFGEGVTVEDSLVDLFEKIDQARGLAIDE